MPLLSITKKELHVVFFYEKVKRLEYKEINYLFPQLSKWIHYPKR
jgi:hypothetical protein